MPIYELECSECGDRTEVFTRTSLSDITTQCLHCGGKLIQLFSPSVLRWKKGKMLITFENDRKFSRPHTPHDARKRDYYF